MKFLAEGQQAAQEIVNKAMKKATKNMGWLMIFCLPALSFGLGYQYDPTSRLIDLQSNYPGGIQALYLSCADKFSGKLNYLKSLGITFSDAALQDESYRFLGSCIYGESDFQAAHCGAGFSGMSCQPVTLPVDLPTLKRLSTTTLSSVAQANITASFY